MATEHIAGEAIDGIQRCVRCDLVIYDARLADVGLGRPWFAGVIVVEAGRQLSTHVGWFGEPLRACR